MKHGAIGNIRLILTCAACGKEDRVDPNTLEDAPYYVCAECKVLIARWQEESRREAREAAERALASPRYAAVCALLTWQGARAAAQTDG